VLWIFLMRGVGPACRRRACKGRRACHVEALYARDCSAAGTPLRPLRPALPQVFNSMDSWGLPRDAITYSAVISALSKGRQWSLGACPCCNCGC